MDREEKSEDRWLDPQEKILEALKLQTKCLRDVRSCLRWIGIGVWIVVLTYLVLFLLNIWYMIR